VHVQQYHKETHDDSRETMVARKRTKLPASSKSHSETYSMSDRMLLCGINFWICCPRAFSISFASQRKTWNGLSALAIS